MSGPEIDLLLLCASPVRDSRRSARLRELLDGDLDFERLQDLADSHRLLPLLYWALKELRPEIVPPSLEQRFQENTLNNMRFTRELFRLLDLFERESIPAIPFKGPGLAVAAYGNLALRSFDDLDILVPSAHISRAQDLLRRSGYIPRLRLSPAREAAWLFAYDEAVFDSNDGQTLLELHWTFVPFYFSSPLDIQAVWDCQVKILLGNRMVPALNPEDMLLVLCLHGSKHCWSHLGFISDLAHFSTVSRLNWDELLGRARMNGTHRMVLLGLALASELLGTPLAEPVCQDIEADKSVSILAGDVIRTLFEPPREPSILRQSLFHMRMRERFRDRLRYAFRLTTRPGIEDWQIIDLPRPFSFLYFLARYPRLALKYVLRQPAPDHSQRS